MMEPDQSGELLRRASVALKSQERLRVVRERVEALKLKAEEVGGDRADVIVMSAEATLTESENELNALVESVRFDIDTYLAKTR